MSIEQRMSIEIINVKDIPLTLKPKCLYISEKYETAIHLCFCGCHYEVVTPLSKDMWDLRITGKKGEEKTSLHPSIWSKAMHCKSHYWIINNAVHWVLK